jgi:hypothetical protein
MSSIMGVYFLNIYVKEHLLTKSLACVRLISLSRLTCNAKYEYICCV